MYFTCTYCTKTVQDHNPYWEEEFESLTKKQLQAFLDERGQDAIKLLKAEFVGQDRHCSECAKKQRDKLKIYCYKQGVIEGLRMYAYWKDGVQYVGTCGTTLEEAIRKVENTEYQVNE